MKRNLSLSLAQLAFCALPFHSPLEFQISAQQAAGASQTPAPQDAPANTAQQGGFASPRRIEAGGRFLGTKRLYPSPVVRDMNGDGLADLVVGDLWGKITIAMRVAGKGPLAFEADTELKAADGKAIDFHNW